MKIAVLVFPGSNCDRDTGEIFKNEFSQEVDYIWHKNAFKTSDYKLLVLPGGFSYGDYLRSGAIARFSSAMNSLSEYASKGGAVLGICNGFQILCEAELLPGALTLNNSLKHKAFHVEISKVNSSSLFTKDIPATKLNIPVSHSEGAYYINKQGLAELQENDQIAFRYEKDINGSVDKIAGVLNKAKNIMGMMPHPERATDRQNFNTPHGRAVLESILNNL